MDSIMSTCDGRRELSRTNKWKAQDRFITLCRSDDLIMACFLEYEIATVKVHDLIWVRQPDGWQFRKGVYRKLRLAPTVVVDRLENAGFAVARHEAPAGMVALVGTLMGSRRPARAVKGVDTVKASFDSRTAVCLPRVLGQSRGSRMPTSTVRESYTRCRYISPPRRSKGTPDGRSIWTGAGVVLALGEPTEHSTRPCSKKPAVSSRCDRR